MPPPEPALEPYDLASSQNVLERCIDGSAEVADLLCAQPLLEVSGGGQGVLGHSDEESDLGPCSMLYLQHFSCDSLL